MRMRTVQECRQMLIKSAIKFGVAPKLISERLLSEDDKNDMLAGLVSQTMLDCFVKAWKENGMCDYANGTEEVYSDFKAWGRVTIENAYNRKFTP